MCLPTQMSECYQLSPDGIITSFILNLCVAKTGNGKAEGTAKIAAGTSAYTLPVIGTISTNDTGAEIDLNLEGASTVKVIQSVSIQVLTDADYNAQMASYTVVFIDGKTISVTNAPAKNCV